MIGTAAALIGMAIASAGAKTAGAVMQKKASDKASQIQQAASAQVVAKNDALYNDYKQQMQPYLQSGASSANLLGSLMLPHGAPGSYRPPGPPMRTPMGAPGGGGGGPAPSGMNPWGSGRPMGPAAGPVGPGGPGVSPYAAASDPFAYTGGSLLTPWTARFNPAVPNGLG